MNVVTLFKEMSRLESISEDRFVNKAEAENEAAEQKALSAGRQYGLIRNKDKEYALKIFGGDR